MSAIILALLVIWNFFVSAFNAWSVGRSWAETKAMGGIPRFMNWCAAVMSASGFTWCYLVILVLVGQAIPGKYHLPDKYANGVFAAGYLMIIIPVLGSGLAMTIQSWSYFWRERSWSNGAVAGYNSFAQIYNTYEAIHGIPEALGILKDLWNTDDSEDSLKQLGFALVVTLAIMCLIGGIITTTVIVRCTARSVASTQGERARKLKSDDGQQDIGYGQGQRTRYGV